MQRPSINRDALSQHEPTRPTYASTKMERPSINRDALGQRELKRSLYA